MPRRSEGARLKRSEGARLRRGDFLALTVVSIRVLRVPGTPQSLRYAAVRQVCKVLARDAAVRRLREVLARYTAVRRARGAFHVRVEVAAVGGGRSRRACGGVPGQCVGGIIQRLT